MKHMATLYLMTCLLLQPLCLQADRGAALVSPKKFRDLILLIDPEASERNYGQIALTSHLAEVLVEKSAPILTSGSVLDHLLQLYLAPNEKSKAFLEIFERYPKDDQKLERKKQLEELWAKSPLGFKEFIKLIPLNLNDWLIFFHDQADLALLVPKAYLQKYFPGGDSLGQVRQAGFNVGPGGHLTLIDTPLDSLRVGLQQLGQKKGTFVDAVKNSLLGNKKGDPDRYQWNIYAIGHGGLAKTVAELAIDIARTQGYLSKTEADIKTLEQQAQKSSDNALFQQLLAKQFDRSIFAQTLERYQRIAGSKNAPASAATKFVGSAHIAGLIYDDFIDLVSHFQTIDTSYFHYVSCFQGGYNQEFVKKSLNSLKVDFLISSLGLGDTPTESVALSVVIPSSSYTPGLVLPHQFSLFFSRLRLFLGEPQKFVAERTSKEAPKDLPKDPIVWILSPIIRESLLTNQTYIRIPRVGVFTPLNYTKNVKLITRSLVLAASLEDAPIVVDADVAEIFVSKIPVPLHLKKRNCALAVLVRPLQAEQEESVALWLKEVRTTQTYIADFLHQLLRLNVGIKLTCIIEKLTCFAGDPLVPGAVEPIECSNCMFRAQVADAAHNGKDFDVQLSGMLTIKGKNIAPFCSFFDIKKYGPIRDTITAIGKLQDNLNCKEHSELFKTLVDAVRGFSDDVPREQIGSLWEMRYRRFPETTKKLADARAQKTVSALGKELMEIQQLADSKAKDKKIKGFAQRLERIFAAGSIDKEAYDNLKAQIASDVKEAAQVPRAKPTPPPLPPLPAQKPAVKPTPPPLPPLPRSAGEQAMKAE